MIEEEEEDCNLHQASFECSSAATAVYIYVFSSGAPCIGDEKIVEQKDLLVRIIMCSFQTLLEP